MRYDYCNVCDILNNLNYYPTLNESISRKPVCNGKYNYNETLECTCTCTFNRSPFIYFVQEVNEIWYAGKTII